MADTFQRVFLGGLGARPTRRFGMTAAMGGMVPRLVDVVSGCARSPSPAPPTHTHVLLRHCDRPPSAISHADAPATQIAAESAAELLEAAFDGKLCQDNVVMQPGSLYWDAAACSAKVRRVAYSSRRLKGSRDDLLERTARTTLCAIWRSPPASSTRLTRSCRDFASFFAASPARLSCTPQMRPVSRTVCLRRWPNAQGSFRFRGLAAWSLQKCTIGVSPIARSKQPRACSLAWGRASRRRLPIRRRQWKRLPPSQRGCLRVTAQRS